MGGRLLSAMAGARAEGAAASLGRSCVTAALPLERCLVEYCAPTLAGIKTASMFCIPLEDAGCLEAQVAQWDAVLRGKGLSLRMMRRQGDRALLYLFRPVRLQQDLDQPGARSLLARYGYRAFQAEEALAQLQTRLREQGGFPHEIGLFLGYPLGDVAGFIRNRGKNCKCSGCWKVYCNELEAQKRFAQIQKCRQVYTRLWTQGRSLWQLTVAA